MSEARRGALVVVAAALLAGCFTHEPYLVDRELLVRARALPDAARPRAVIAARRANDGRAVQVRLATLNLDAAQPASATTTRVPSHTLNRMVTAAQVLTWVGSAVSIAGTAVFLSYDADVHRAPGATAGIVALSAEPVMLTGTLLWIFGETRSRPEEVHSPRAAGTELFLLDHRTGNEPAVSRRLDGDRPLAAACRECGGGRGSGRHFSMVRDRGASRDSRRDANG